MLVLKTKFIDLDMTLMSHLFFSVSISGARSRSVKIKPAGRSALPTASWRIYERDGIQNLFCLWYVWNSNVLEFDFEVRTYVCKRYSFFSISISKFILQRQHKRKKSHLCWWRKTDARISKYLTFPLTITDDRKKSVPPCRSSSADFTVSEI